VRLRRCHLPWPPDHVLQRALSIALAPCTECHGWHKAPAVCTSALLRFFAVWSMPEAKESRTSPNNPDRRLFVARYRKELMHDAPSKGPCTMPSGGKEMVHPHGACEMAMHLLSLARQQGDLYCLTSQVSEAKLSHALSQAAR